MTRQQTLTAKIAPHLIKPYAKVILFALCLLPFAALLGSVLFNPSALGANPAEYLIRELGQWSLRFLCLTLAITPLRTMLGMPSLARFRRMLGLFVFFYVCLHLLGYAWFDKELNIPEIAKDIYKRPFILVGFLGFVLLAPLALTSFNKAIKWMGAKRWQLLHKLVYVIAGLSILHFFWMRAGKNNFAEVFVYAGVLAVLLGWRVWHKFKK
jgi:methionine sulfoxide reductase heme-binding subunit